MATGASTIGLPDLSVEHQQMVQETLQSILDSPQFCKSKRYPALLEYAVHNTLEGNSGALKERIIGIAVFGRPSNYDPGTDPVVRIAAGEVRRRLTQYFSEHPESPVRIDLPIGGYAIELHFRPQPQRRTSIQNTHATASTDPDCVEIPSAANVPHATEIPRTHGWTAAYHWDRRRWTAGLAAAALVLAAAGIGIWTSVQQRHRQEFWWPVLHGGQPPMVVVGRRGQVYTTGASGAQPVTVAPNPSEWPTLAMDDVVVVAQTCNLLREYKHDCSVVSSPSTTLENLRGKTIISIGGFNNNWTQNLLAPLRYGFQLNEKKNRLIVDRQSSGYIPVVEKDTGDVTGLQSDTDYALIGRFHSDITGGMVVIIAGFGPAGTDGAGQFVFSPSSVSQLMVRAPKDWKGVNFEAVLQMDVVKSNPHPAKVIAAQFW